MIHGLMGYWFIGFCFGVVWTAQVARHPIAGKDLSAWECVWGALALSWLWPVVIIEWFDSENRWKR